jgi:hypothetical protein
MKKMQCMRITSMEEKRKIGHRSRWWPDTRTDWPTDRRSRGNMNLNYSNCVYSSFSSVTYRESRDARAMGHGPPEISRCTCNRPWATLRFTFEVFKDIVSAEDT